MWGNDGFKQKIKEKVKIGSILLTDVSLVHVSVQWPFLFS